MGRQQPHELDQLIDLKVESIAENAARDAASSTVLKNERDIYRLLLVAVDAPPNKNTWTHRYVTDAEWRFENKYDNVPKSTGTCTRTTGSNNNNFDRWVTVQLWTDQDPTAQYIQQETGAALYRAAHGTPVGIPVTLEEMITQEGRSMAFAGGGRHLKNTITMDAEDLDYSRQILLQDPLLRQSAHYPTCFAALYGDEVAKSVGYPALGLSYLTGFQVGLVDVLEEAKRIGEGHHGCPFDHVLN